MHYLFLPLGKKYTKQVAELLATEYPALFRDDVGGAIPAFSGYGLGGLKGVKGLPDTICDKVIFFVFLGNIQTIC